MNPDDPLMMAASALSKGFISQHDFSDFIKDPAAASVANLTQILKKNGVQQVDEVLTRLEKTRNSTLGKFLIIEKIGRGGGGEVYHALDLTLRRPVALKLLSTVDPQEIERFRREAQLAAKLQHSNIIQIYEVGEAEGRSYISMQYVDGVSLEKVPLPLKDALQAIYKVALAVDYANKHGVIHRDVKPSNILLDRKGDVFLTDFGIAKRVGIDKEQSKTLSISGMVIGTPGYLSPEQAKGDLDGVDARTDVYLLGATLYYLVTRRQPFDGENVVQIIERVLNEDPIPPRTLSPQVPRDVELIIQKAMSKEKSARYPTAADFARDVRAYLRGDPLVVRGPSIFEKMTRSWRRSKMDKALIGIAVIELLFAGVLLIETLQVGWEKQELTARREQMVRETALREASAYVAMGDMYMERREIDNAIQAYSRALHADPEYARAYHKRGIAFYEQGRWAEAYKDFRRVTELMPQLAQTLESYIATCQRKITER